MGLRQRRKKGVAMESCLLSVILPRTSYPNPIIRSMPHNDREHLCCLQSSGQKRLNTYGRQLYKFGLPKYNLGKVLDIRSIHSL